MSFEGFILYQQKYGCVATWNNRLLWYGIHDRDSVEDTFIWISVIWLAGKKKWFSEF